MIFGDILKFVSKPISENADKIYRLGHLTLYKNTEEMKCLFKKDGGMFSYKEVLSNPEFYSFDEHAGMISISLKQGVNCYYREDMADISCRIKRMTASRHPNYQNQVFYYENGKVFRAYIIDSEVKTEEFVYIHIQKRKFEFSSIGGSFFILSDRFVPKEEGVPSEELIKELSEFVSAEQDNAELSEFRKNKIKGFIKCSFKEKIIWLKIKKAERNLQGK